VAYVLVVGFLSFRAQAVELGVLVDWSNTPRSVTMAGSPWLQRTAVAAVTGIAVLVLWPRRNKARKSWGQAAAVALTLTAVAGWFLLTTEYPYAGAVSSSLTTEDAQYES